MQLLKDNWLIFWFLGIFFIELLVYQKQYIKNKEAIGHWNTNLSNFVATKLLSIVVLVPCITYASTHSTGPLSNSNPFISITIGLLILDLAGYMFHRASHEIEFLWRFHEIHHLDEILDVSTSLRVHFMEAFFHTSINCLVVYLLGIDKDVIAIHSLTAFIFATYHHSRFKLPLKMEKKISFLITTPRFHEPHHDKDKKTIGPIMLLYSLYGIGYF